MKRTVGGLIVLLVVLPLLGGCKLPRVKINPRPGQPGQSTPAAKENSGDQAPAAQNAGGAATGSTDQAGEETSGTVSQPEPGPAPVVKGTLPRPAGGSGGGTAASRRPRYVPVGAQRTLTSSDLRGLSKWQLDVLRNEIYAAHGRRFDRSDLRAYFERQTWYVPDAGFSESRLSALEKRNAAFIAAYQKGGGRSSGGSRTTTTRRTGGGQILPFSSDRALTSGDLSGLSSWQLTLARNEIYARHGRPFKRADLRNYFRGQGWYSEDPGFSESRLSSLEKRNAEFIRRHE